MLFTGGTISMTDDFIKGGSDIALSSNDLVSRINNKIDFVKLDHLDVFDKPSPNITFENLIRINHIINENYNDYDGFVVVHGTDTLEESAFFLDLISNKGKPIVFTGSMKNASQLGYDGLTNLVSSLYVASSNQSIGLGVLVVLNDQINSAIEVTKTNTTNLDTFKSPEFGPLGIVDSNQVIYYRTNHRHIGKVFCPKKLSLVGIIKMYIDPDLELLKKMLIMPYKGIIIEGLGRGNVPQNVVDIIDQFIKKGVVIMIVSRSLTGRVYGTYSYIGGGKDLVSKGVILGSNLSSQKARILLMLAISNGLNNDEISKLIN
jgi:L-asparaginase